MSASTDAGFHAGELAVQRRAGVHREAARLSGMVEPAALSGGFARFLAERTFLVLTGRDAEGRLWTSVLVGPPGFLQARSATQLMIHAAPPPADPLHGLAAGQKIGLTAIEFAARRRVRVNGTLSVATDGFLLVEAEQAFGNCPRYIHPRLLTADDPADLNGPNDPNHPGSLTGLDAADAEHARRDITLSTADIELIRAADTFFLGTVNPERGADTSHRGGEPGFVRIDGQSLWWPDYSGNNMFNSLGNLAVNPEAALLFFDFAAGRTLQLSGSAEIEWEDPTQPADEAATGRIVRFTTHHLVADRLLGAHQIS